MSFSVTDAAADVSIQSDMYSLGLVLYELYHPFNTESERCHCLHAVRDGRLDDEFKQHWPLEVLVSASRHRLILTLIYNLQATPEK